MATVNEFGYDRVISGYVVGGEGTTWCIAYDERPQSGKMYTDGDDGAAIAEAKIMIAELREKWNGICYPDKDAWTIRIYES